jgi:hypothetical protein
MSRVTGLGLRCLPFLLVVFVLLLATELQAQNFGFGRSVGGISIDPEGTVRHGTVQDRDDLLKFMRERVGKVQAEFAPAVGMRCVSWRGLEAAIADAVANKLSLADAVWFLGGLQRVQYILVYPDRGDIVLAGPGEGWKVDETGNVVGVTTGRPVLRLDDLLIALRTANAARDEGISVSIDPTAQGRQRFEAVLKKQRTFDRAVIKQLGDALGPQQVTFTGIPTDSHFARVLFAADYRMKRYAMNLESAPVKGLPGYLDLLRAKNRLPGTAMPRWWMACNYQPLACSDDKLAWEIRGPGVKAMTEDEAVAADGTVAGTGREDPVAKEWANLLTKHYEEVSQKDAVFAELRNLMDLCVAAAVIQKEDLVGLSGGRGFPLLMNSEHSLALDQWPAPKSVGTQCSFLKVGRNFVITASGGVQIESWQVASQQEVSPQIKEVHAKAVAHASDAWCWN